MSSITLAREFRDYFGSMALCESAISTTVNTIASDVPGMTVYLEPWQTYLIDGYIAYESNATADLSISFTTPEGSVLFLAGFGSDATPSGNLNAIWSNQSTGLLVGGGASPAGVCRPRGSVFNVGNAGVLQLQFAQNTSNASTTTVKSGSWLRASRALRNG